MSSGFRLFVSIVTGLFTVLIVMFVYFGLSSDAVGEACKQLGYDEGKIINHKWTCVRIDTSKP